MLLYQELLCTFSKGHYSDDKECNWYLDIQLVKSGSWSILGSLDTSMGIVNGSSMCMEQDRGDADEDDGKVVSLSVAVDRKSVV